MKRALLLNADYTPLHFISDWRAIRLVMLSRAEIVIDFQTGLPSVWDDEAFTSPGLMPTDPLRSVAIPATLRMYRKIHKKWKPPRFRSQVLFNRDDWTCQYCGTKLSWKTVEIEHVVPLSRGGPTTWLNCVSACRDCNKRKGNRTPDEVGMKLLKKPASPTALHFWDAAKTDCYHPSWDTFLPKER